MLYTLTSGKAVHHHQLQNSNTSHLVCVNRWLGAGDGGRTSRRWTTRNSAEVCATIMTRILSTRRLGNATCTASSVTSRTYWATQRRTCIFCWEFNLTRTTEHCECFSVLSQVMRFLRLHLEIQLLGHLHFIVWWGSWFLVWRSLRAWWQEVLTERFFIWGEWTSWREMHCSASSDSIGQPWRFIYADNRNGFEVIE